MSCTHLTPTERGQIRALHEVRRALLVQFGALAPLPRAATVDQDATTIERRKRETGYTHKRINSDQPVVAAWAEAEFVLADEFRDGNVPAQMAPLNCATQGFAALPHEMEELDFVPGEKTEKKDTEPLCYVGLRLGTAQGELFGDGNEYHCHAFPSNRCDMGGGDPIEWNRAKASTVEHVHDEMKNDLGAGQLPSAKLGANAVCFRIVCIAFNNNAGAASGLAGRVRQARLTQAAGLDHLQRCGALCARAPPHGLLVSNSASGRPATTP